MSSSAPHHGSPTSSGGEATPARERSETLSEALFGGGSLSPGGLGGIAAEDTTSTPGRTSIGTQHDNFRYAEWWYTTLHPAMTAISAASPPGRRSEHSVRSELSSAHSSVGSSGLGLAETGGAADPPSTELRSNARGVDGVATATVLAFDEASGSKPPGDSNTGEEACSMVTPVLRSPRDVAALSSPTQQQALRASPSSSTSSSTSAKKKAKKKRSAASSENSLPPVQAQIELADSLPSVGPVSLNRQSSTNRQLNAVSSRITAPSTHVDVAAGGDAVLSKSSSSSSSGGSRSAANAAGGPFEALSGQPGSGDTANECGGSRSNSAARASSSLAATATAAPPLFFPTTVGAGRKTTPEQNQRVQSPVPAAPLAAAALPSAPVPLMPPSPSPMFSHELEVFVANRLKLNPYDVGIRWRLLAIMEALVSETLGPTAKLEVHGSFATGLALRTSDVDFLVSGYESLQPLTVIEMLTNALLAGSATDSLHHQYHYPTAEAAAAAAAQAVTVAASAPASKTPPTWTSSLPFPVSSMPIEGELYIVQTVIATRVPVIKVTEKLTGLKADVSFGGGEHWVSMQLTKGILDMHPTCQSLLLLLKYCVKRFGIGETEAGGMTSFPLYLLVSHFFQEGLSVVTAVRGGLSVPARAPRPKSPPPQTVVAEQPSAELHVPSPLQAQSGASQELGDLIRQVVGGNAAISASIEGFCEPAALPHLISSAPPPPPMQQPPLPQTTTVYSDELTVMAQSSSSLAQVLFDFCVYYSYFFDYDKAGLRFDADGTSHVVEKPLPCLMRNQHLHLTSPFDPTHDVTARMPHTRDFVAMCMGLSTLVHCPGSLHGVLSWISPDTMMEDLGIVRSIICEQYMIQQQQQMQQHRYFHQQQQQSGRFQPHNVASSHHQQRFGSRRGRGGWQPVWGAPPSAPQSPSAPGPAVLRGPAARGPGQGDAPASGVSTGTMTSLPQAPPIVPPTMVAGARGYLVPFNHTQPPSQLRPPHSGSGTFAADRKTAQTPPPPPPLPLPQHSMDARSVPAPPPPPSASGKSDANLRDAPRAAAGRAGPHAAVRAASDPSAAGHSRVADAPHHGAAPPPARKKKGSNAMGSSALTSTAAPPDVGEEVREREGSSTMLLSGEQAPRHEGLPARRRQSRPLAKTHDEVPAAAHEPPATQPAIGS
jgi:DNA polymerase sigma